MLSFRPQFENPLHDAYCSIKTYVNSIMQCKTFQTKHCDDLITVQFNDYKCL